MRILLIFLGTLAFTACKKENKTTEEAVETTTTIIAEANAWKMLFDGKTFEGWHIYMTENLPDDEWSIEDNAMVFNPNPNRTEGGKNIISDKEYTNFKLSLEWKISKGGNSGIFWGVKEDTNYKEAYETGPEIQVLDNINFLDTNSKHKAGALYDMVSPSKDTTKPIGEWNTCILYINHKTNEGNVWLNDVLIVKFPVNGKNWDEMVAHSKFKDWEGFGKFTTGKIGLQDHGNKVWYRNIKIQEL